MAREADPSTRRRVRGAMRGSRYRAEVAILEINVTAPAAANNRAGTGRRGVAPDLQKMGRPRASDVGALLTNNASITRSTNTPRSFSAGRSGGCGRSTLLTEPRRESDRASGGNGSRGPRQVSYRFPFVLCYRSIRNTERFGTKGAKGVARPTTTRA